MILFDRIGIVTYFEVIEESLPRHGESAGVRRSRQ